MEIIDLYASGRELWAELDSANTAFYPEVVNRAEPIDELVSAFLHTEFQLASVHAPISKGRDFTVLSAPIVIHPEHGVTFIHIGSDSSPYPDLPDSMDPDIDPFFYVWTAIEEEFGWEDVPLSTALLNARLPRRLCVADFSLAPFEVYFADDLANLPDFFRDRPTRTRRDEVYSALGAINMVSHVTPLVYEGCELTCSRSLARQLWGTATPQHGLPMLH